MITNIQQVTLEWLKSVMQRNGKTADSFTHFKLDPSASTNGHIAKIQLYQEDQPPVPLLLKIYQGEMFGNPSEIYFYTRDYVGLADAPTPFCYDAEYDNTQPGYHLLLEDLSATHQSGWQVEPTLAYGRAAAEALATLHAYRWGTEKLTAVEAAIPGEKEILCYLTAVQPGLKPLLAETADEIPASWHQALRDIFQHHPPKMVERAQNPAGFTLVHGDPNPGNILQPKAGAGKVYLIDRQPFEWSLTTWLGVSDVAYMMVHWWDTELRRAWEFPILRAWHDTLLRGGVTNYSWEQAVADYKLTAVQSLYVAILWCTTEQEHRTMKWVWLPQLQKAMNAFFDLQCGDLWSR